MSELYANIVAAISRIPEGKVATYAQIAELAGNSRAARTVSYVLHSSSRKLNLPWHRVINSRGAISLPRGGGYERQKKLLRGEGVKFDERDRIDLKAFGWRPARRRSARPEAPAKDGGKNARRGVSPDRKKKLKKKIRTPDERED
ncbi:MAG: methylated-DNA--[protein]-cysteine S-methyltransferase [Leptospirales bacterium]